MFSILSSSNQLTANSCQECIVCFEYVYPGILAHSLYRPHNCFCVYDVHAVKLASNPKIVPFALPMCRAQNGQAHACRPATQLLFGAGVLPQQTLLFSSLVAQALQQDYNPLSLHPCLQLLGARVLPLQPWSGHAHRPVWQVGQVRANICDELRLRAFCKANKAFSSNCKSTPSLGLPCSMCMFALHRSYTAHCRQCKLCVAQKQDNANNSLLSSKTIQCMAANHLVVAGKANTVTGSGGISSLFRQEPANF
eukprot:1136823-Pelagomonas_calceolata.AAC.8